MAQSSPMDNMGWFCAGFGVCFACAVLLAIAADLHLACKNDPTISESVYLATTKKMWVAILTTIIITAPVFMLIGHLFFPHAVLVHKDHDKVSCQDLR